MANSITKSDLLELKDELKDKMESDRHSIYQKIGVVQSEVHEVKESIASLNSLKNGVTRLWIAITALASVGAFLFTIVWGEIDEIERLTLDHIQEKSAYAQDSK